MQKLCECGCGNPTPLAKQTSARRGQKQGEPIRFIQGHSSRLQVARKLTDPDSAAFFWSRVNKNPGQGPAGECWEWQGAKLAGYGLIGFDKKVLRANRVAYYFTHGDIPEGLFICHSCDNPSCCNPAHLRADTPKSNTEEMCAKNRRVSANALKTICKRGHGFTAENTRINSLGRRICITCEDTIRKPAQRQREQAKKDSL